MTTPAAIGQPVTLPPLALLDGRRLDPPAWPGDALVIVFFETSCAFCHDHDQRLERLSAATRGRGLRVIGAAGDRSAAAVADYARRLGLHYELTLDAEGALRALFTTRRVSPFTVVIDRQGVLREAIPGALSEDDALGLARWGTTS